jgi:1-acyl-sn-glycerol-3-phosphate acyltransferase
MGAPPPTRIWRVLRSALGWAAFGALCAALGLVVLPLARRLSRGSASADLRAQRAIHRAARLYLRICWALDLCRVRVDGEERLRLGPPHLVVANHPSLLDVVAILSLAPQLDCIVNAARAKHPFLRRLTTAAGYIPNDGGREVVAEATRRLRAGRSLLVFPEGTRSPRDELGPFQRGAAHIALASGYDLLPVVIACDPPTLGKGERWYEVPERRFELSLQVGQPLSPQPLLDSGLTPPLAARRLSAELREVFAKGLEGSHVAGPRS